jgi:pyruvate kinase
LSEVDLQEYIKKIRRAESIVNKPIGILVDLQGPKIRIGSVSKDQNILTKGDVFVLDNLKEIGNNKRVYLSNKKIFKSVKKGHLILIDDGNIHLKITSIKENLIRTKVFKVEFLNQIKA